MSDTTVSAVYHDLDDPAYTREHYEHDLALDEIMETIRSLSKDMADWELEVLEQWNTVVVLEKERRKVLKNIDIYRQVETLESGFPNMKDAFTRLHNLENKIINTRNTLERTKTDFTDRSSDVEFLLARSKLKTLLMKSAPDHEMVRGERASIRRRFFDVTHGQYVQHVAIKETRESFIKNDCAMLFECIGNFEAVELFRLMWRSPHPDEKSETYEVKLTSQLQKIKNHHSHYATWLEYLMNPTARTLKMDVSLADHCRYPNIGIPGV